MCLIALSYHNNPRYPLVVIANRDEFYSRPTRPAMFWPEQRGILAGRDEVSGGTWLGFDRGGRFAAITNFRDPRVRHPSACSRGTLVSSFLMGRDTAAAYLDGVHHERRRYNHFNLLVGDETGLFYYASIQGKSNRLAPGIYGLSNGVLDTPWLKVQKTAQALARLLDAHTALAIEPLFRVLVDTEIAPDHLLPDTGIGLEWERQLSPLFVRSPGYGTRSSTVVMLDQAGQLLFAERTFDETGKAQQTLAYRFEIERASFTLDAVEKSSGSEVPA
ncbi:MAG: NRDE family protein [Gammaproteobacteria bacterium]